MLGLHFSMHWIFAHFIGDFLIQNDWMAQKKKMPGWDGWRRCLVHCITYMIPFLFCGLEAWQLVLIFLQHFYIDRTGFVTWFMRVKGSGQFSTGPCFPWSQIVVDNILHILWIAMIVWVGKLV